MVCRPTPFIYAILKRKGCLESPVRNPRYERHEKSKEIHKGVYYQFIEKEGKNVKVVAILQFFPAALVMNHPRGYS